MTAGPPRILVALGLLLLATAGCTFTLRSQVLDARTREPIPGAHRRRLLDQSRWHARPHLPCARGARETTTDAQGRFALERLQQLNGLYDEQIIVYKLSLPRLGTTISSALSDTDARMPRCPHRPP